MLYESPSLPHTHAISHTHMPLPTHSLSHSLTHTHVQTMDSATPSPERLELSTMKLLPGGKGLIEHVTLSDAEVRGEESRVEWDRGEWSGVEEMIG